MGVIGSSLAMGMCMAILPVPGHLAAWSVPLVALPGALATALAGAIAWRAGRHSRLAQELKRRARPVELAGVQVQHVEGLDAALVAGLRRPRIYCDRDLADRLTTHELRAVLLHERHHQLDRAPAKLVVLEAIAPVLRIVQAGRAWLEHRYAALEIAADRYAIEHSVSRASLAGALIKLAPARQTFGVGFASAADLRLKALLDGDLPPKSASPATWLAAVGAAAAVCVALLAIA
ncbi:MAG: hypothetical protein ACRDH5_07340 [bacterium]